MEKFSYSKISAMDTSHGGCPYRYKLTYVDKHFINQSSIATEIGTLIHETEENIANQIKDSLFTPNVQYDFLIENIKTKFKEIEEKYPSEAKEKDKSGRTYKQKIKEYLETGIYRLEQYFDNNPNLDVFGAEVEFEWKYNEKIFHGFIDRIFYDKLNNKYIIEDIKSYAIPVEDKDLKTPLQFVIYTNAFSELYGIPLENIECHYDLPFCQLKQDAGTKGFVKRGCEKIDKLFDAIEKEEFEPHPSPLCHWCIFSKTYPNQPEEAKYLCPYFCHWTKNNKDMSVEYEWSGPEDTPLILEAFKSKETTKEIKKLQENVIEIRDNTRRFILRR